MYCPQCGAENAEGNKICSKCGAALTDTASPTATPGTTQPTLVTQRTSGMAIASLVLGILGFFLTLPSIFAIIFGGIALSQIGKNPELKGKGLAIAGLVLGIIVVILAVVSFIFIMQWVATQL
jgi:uncharacterized membrane protein YvbJ